MVHERLRGSVVFIKRENGFGFIRDHINKKDYFFPASEITGVGFDEISVGDELIFTLTVDHQNRPKAIEVQGVDVDD